MRKQHTVTYLTAQFNNPFRSATYVLRLLARLLQRRTQGYRILHVHWLHTLTVPDFVPFAKHIAFLQTSLFLSWARLLGYRLVWTAHNVLPHATITSNDLAIRRKLSRSAAAIIVHSTSTIAALASHGLNTKVCQLIPHGSYIGVYPNTLILQQARKKLRLPRTAKVITFFGAIHSYKNVPELVSAFLVVARKNSDVYLLIAGRCKDENLLLAVATAQEAVGDRIRLYDAFIPDDDIQLYLNAADVCAFPFTEITTSGSVLLAASFGKPIVAPYIGALQDMPKSIGKLYNPTTKTALSSALTNVLSHDKERLAMAEASLQYAQSLDWYTIASQTVGVYVRINTVAAAPHER